MRLAELFDAQRFRIVEQERPVAAAGEVVVRVSDVGVCGSDLHWFTDEGIGRSRIRYPAVLGHEPTGSIAGIGTGVTGWSEGDKAALEPAIFCYHCEFCLSGHHNVCANGRFLSSGGEPGYFREFVAIPALNLLPLPKNLSFGEGTLFEPLAVILNAMDSLHLRPGETVAVYGGGPIGLLMLAMLKLAGAGRVWVVEPVPGRRDLALAMGADAVIDPRQEHPPTRILRDTGMRGVDASIDCATKEDTLNECLLSTRAAGRVIVLGIFTGERLPLELHVMRNRELTLKYIHRSRHQHGAEALRLLETYPRRFTPVLTHTRPLESIEQGFQMLEDKSEGVGKLVITL